MSAETAWYNDEATLLAELREENQSIAPPRIVGYDDIRELRRGGQGVVYVATQQSTSRRVAVKVLLLQPGSSASGAQAHERFQREISLVASFKHPNIVKLYDSGLTEDGRPYLIMELIEGWPLDEFLAQQPLSHERIVQLFQSIADAVSYAHQRGVIHRDLKPANVRVTQEGVAHVLDFGLARLVDDAAATGSTQTLSLSGQFIGSLPWASPEQAGGEMHAADVRSDVYAIGVMLYHALVGRYPYDVTGSLHAVLENILHAEPLRLRQHDRTVSEELDVIVHRCLVKDPDRRYQSAAELAADLDRYRAGEPIQARADSAWYLLRKQMRRYRVAMASTAAIAVIAVAAAAVSMVFWSNAALQREAAESAREETGAVNAFLHSMLESVDPAIARGRDVTVAEILDQATLELQRETHPPLVRASLHQTIGWTYLTLGRRSDAIDHLHAAHDLRRQHLGADHTDTLDTALALGRALMEHEDFDASQNVLDAAAVHIHRRFDPADDLTLQLEGHRAYLLHYLGELEESREAYERVLAGYEQRGELTHEEAVSTSNNLAALLTDMGAYDEAGALYEQAVTQQTEALGPDAPRTITARANLAMHYSRLNQQDEALPLMQQAVADAQRVLGEAHPSTLAHRLNLAVLQTEAGQYDAAEAEYETLLPALRETFGSDKSDTLRAMANYGYALMELDRLDEANDILRQTVTTMSERFGHDHFQTLSARHNLAGVLEKQGQYEQARAQLAQVHQARVRVLGANHFETLLTYNNLAWLHLKDNDAAAAEAMFAEIIAAMRESMGEEHWVVHLIRGSRGRALIDLGREDEAREVLLDVRARFVEIFGEDHARTNRVQEFLDMLDTSP